MSDRHEQCVAQTLTPEHKHETGKTETPDDNNHELLCHKYWNIMRHIFTKKISKHVFLLSLWFYENKSNFNEKSDHVQEPDKQLPLHDRSCCK